MIPNDTKIVMNTAINSLASPTAPNIAYPFARAGRSTNGTDRQLLLTRGHDYWTVCEEYCKPLAI